MKISVVYDDFDFLARYLCFTARSVQLGTFALDDYAVLPRLVKHCDKVVYFPDLGYTSEFWKLIDTLDDYSIPKIQDRYLLDLVQDLLCKKIFTYKERELLQLMTAWKQQELYFLEALGGILHEQVLEHIDTVFVLITEIGTSGSFSVLKQSHLQNIWVTARVDLGVTNINLKIVKGILSSMQRGYSDVGTLGYIQRNGISDFLVRQSRLSPFLTPAITKEVPVELYVESRDYLHRLGVDIREDEFDYVGFMNTLNKQQSDVFSYLWRYRGVVVSFDDLGSILWKDHIDEKFSFYAMAKLIESLRTKLRDFGVNKQMIFTKRKIGYMVK